MSRAAREIASVSASLSEAGLPVGRLLPAADASRRTGPMNSPSDAPLPWCLMPIACFIEIARDEACYRVHRCLRISA